MAFPKKTVLGLLTAGAILYGMNYYGEKLKDNLNRRDFITKLATKSLVDTFNIKLSKEDSLLFQNYLKEYTTHPNVQKAIVDIQKIAKDTSLLAMYNKDLGGTSINRDRILERITDMLISGSNSVLSLKADSLRNELALRLEKYSEYQKFKQNWIKNASDVNYSKIFSKKFMPKETIKKDTIIRRDTTDKKPRSLLQKRRR